MAEATLIYPHQLFENSPALSKERVVYFVEEPLLLTHNPIHRQKLIFHKLTMDAYEEKLAQEGYKVHRLDIQSLPESATVFAKLTTDGITKIHVVDTTDYLLEKALLESGIERVWYESPLFILDKEDAVERYKKSGRFMAKFYKQLRIDKDILIKSDNSPVGGQWSFDEENRKKIPKGTETPTEPHFIENEHVTKATEWATSVKAEQYGEPGCWLPYSHEDAQAFLHDFLTNRFTYFGDYEDAIEPEELRLWHSTLSPLLNVGLLTPQEVLEEALSFAQEHETPLNSVEGFIRQILGWREFIRASYECDGVTMRTKNFWNHKRPLPRSFWDASVSIDPVDDAIGKALDFGYTHHIERLMVLGNIMLLLQTKPDDVYAWFMGMHVDAYDWVMVPNVYGMSQFSDGGLFATKPYISGSNYIKKMSHYKSGDWEEIWTALYWNFIATHQAFFRSNHRLSMMPRMLEKMDERKRKNYEAIAQEFLQK